MFVFQAIYEALIDRVPAEESATKITYVYMRVA